MVNFVIPKAVLLDEKDLFRKIEMAGRTCYKSEAHITTDSARKFVKGLMKRSHTAMVEHATVVFEIKQEFMDANPGITIDVFRANPFLHVTTDNDRIFVSGNIRAINEQNDEATIALRYVLKENEPDLVYAPVAGKVIPITGICLIDFDTITSPTKEEIEAHKYLTFCLTTDRGVTHELVRHRPCSFAQESTRYVNYKTGISICLPDGFWEKPEEAQQEYQAAFEDANKHYCRLIELGQKPQEARAVLPTATKTEIVVTANIAEWNHIFNLRLFGTTGAPHPDIKALMILAYDAAAADPMVLNYRQMAGLPATTKENN